MRMPPELLQHISSYVHDSNTKAALLCLAGNNYWRILHATNEQKRLQAVLACDAVELFDDCITYLWRDLKSSLRVVMASRSMRILKRLLITPIFSVWTTHEILMSGDPVSLSCLEATTPRCLQTDLDSAAEAGCTETLRFLYAKQKQRCSSRAWQGAAEKGQIKSLEFLHKHDVPFDDWTFDVAAAHGQVQVLRWIHANRSERDSYALITAARENQHEAAKWFLTNDAPSDWTKQEAHQSAWYKNHWDITLLLSGQ